MTRSIKVPRREVVAMFNVLDKLGELPSGVKFAYAVARNKGFLKSEVEATQEATKKTPTGYAEFKESV